MIYANEEEKSEVAASNGNPGETVAFRAGAGLNKEFSRSRRNGWTWPLTHKKVPDRRTDASMFREVERASTQSISSQKTSCHSYCYVDVWM